MAPSGPFARLRTRYDRFEVANHSMAPFLAPGDYLITRLLRPGLRPRRGNLVVYRNRDRFLIKRVIGLPGETVAIEGGVLAIDGSTFVEPWWSAATRPDGVWTLPAESWFVLGDNRPHSGSDSRYAGPVRSQDLHSIAVARYRPLRKVRLLR